MSILLKGERDPRLWTIFLRGGHLLLVLDYITETVLTLRHQALSYLGVGCIVEAVEIYLYQYKLVFREGGGGRNVVEQSNVSDRVGRNGLRWLLTAH